MRSPREKDPGSPSMSSSEEANASNRPIHSRTSSASSWSSSPTLVPFFDCDVNCGSPPRGSPSRCPVNPRDKSLYCLGCLLYCLGKFKVVQPFKRT